MSIEFDFSELSKLAADLGNAPKSIHANVAKAVQVTALKVKRDWQTPLRGSEYVPAGAASISYDVKSGSDVVEAEIGPKVGGAGSLVGMLEYGTPTVGATGYGHAALQKNEADFIKGIQLAAGDIL